MFVIVYMYAYRCVNQKLKKRVYCLRHVYVFA